MEHDCISIIKPYNQYVAPGGTHEPTYSHEFNMYGRESVSDDCQDVRDLMFLMPVHRMQYWNDGGEAVRDTKDSGSGSGKYVNYNQTYAPLMGLFAIIQNPIVGQRMTNVDHMYDLTLEWRSNLLDFVPSGGKYQLYQVITENGVERYVPVYRQYLDGDQVVTTTEPIYVDAHYKSTDDDPERYCHIYVPMFEHGYQVTYAIKAIDSEEFLSLQMSNKRSFIIPGYNLAEKLELHIGDDYTSRFEPQKEKNYYSNQVIINGYTASIAKDFLQAGLADQFEVVRTARTPLEDENGEVIVVDGLIQYDEVPTTIAHATVTELTDDGGKLRIDLVPATQTAASEFPKGKQSGDKAGYHANVGNSFTIDFIVKTEADQEKYVYFWNNDTEQTPTFAFYDNFEAETSTNDHPTEYVYQAHLTTVQPFVASETDASITSTAAESNPTTVYIYKTNMDMAGVFTYRKMQLDGMTGRSRYVLPNAGEFTVDVRFSPKSEVLRYDAYRWEADEERFIIETIDENGDEEDVQPTGSADNNLDVYTIKLDGVPQSEVAVPTDGSTVAAPFVDNYVMAHAGDYIYAPVVETFSGDIIKYDYYNTYGAPLKRTAAATIKAQVASTVNTADCPLMSEKSWKVGDDYYSYYNIPLEFTELVVPTGYEIYQVRAWRQVDKSLLGEQDDHDYRIDDDYLFESMLYGEDMQCDGLTMCKANLLGDHGAYALGSRLLDDTTFNEAFATYATFGAKRLKNVDDKPGSIDHLEADFVVRIYFTPNENPGVKPASGSNAPRQADGTIAAPLAPKDFDYYVAETTVHFDSQEYDTIVTGVSSPVEDRARDIVGVTYVSPMGQLSSRPFGGVNIIVTRYSDGTTSTRKAIY